MNYFVKFSLIISGAIMEIESCEINFLKKAVPELS